MVGAGSGPVKGILKPSRAWTPGAGDDAADEDARRRALAAGKAPERPPRRDEDTATTATYERFHDRVGAVFANLGPGLTTPGASNAARPDPPAWMPANTSVFRRGRDVPDRDDDDDDDSEPDPDDDALEPAHRDPSDDAGPSDDPRRWDDDLDCLRSDDDDDDEGAADDGAGAHPSDEGCANDAHLRRSVGRCVALNREDEYDAYDAVAMTGGRVDITTVAADGRVGGRLEAFANAPDDEEAALRPDSVVVERGDSDGSDDETDGARTERSEGTRVRPSGTRVRPSGNPRETLAPYVPPAKRAKRGVSWAPASAGVSSGVSVPSRASSAAPRRRARGHRVGNSWVPDHVKHPERYTCYTLDEPLIIGGGLSGNGSRAKDPARGGGKGGDSVAVRATASPSRDAAATDDGAEREKQKQKPPIVFRPSAAAAAKRRRSGAVPSSAAGAGAGCVSFAGNDDERDDGSGGGEEELELGVGAGGGFGRARGGNARGNQRRFRSKAASEEEDE